jgi:shikimate kinase
LDFSEPVFGCPLGLLGPQQPPGQEEEVLGELSSLPNCILATGGGAVLRLANRELLREHSKVVYLKSSPEELFRRLRHDRNRPLLQVSDPLARLVELYAERDPLYRQTAHHVFETGRPSVAMLVNMILMQLELSGTGPVG